MNNVSEAVKQVIVLALNTLMDRFADKFYPSKEVIGGKLISKRDLHSLPSLAVNGQASARDLALLIEKAVTANDNVLSVGDFNLFWKKYNKKLTDKYADQSSEPYFFALVVVPNKAIDTGISAESIADVLATM